MFQGTELRVESSLKPRHPGPRVSGRVDNGHLQSGTKNRCSPAICATDIGCGTGSELGGLPALPEVCVMGRTGVPGGREGAGATWEVRHSTDPLENEVNTLPMDAAG